VRSDNIRGGSKPVSVQELKALARKHWEEWLPERVRELRAEGKLDEALHGAARSAQEQLDHLMRDRHYQEHLRIAKRSDPIAISRAFDI
jgi:hypothetical protein